MTNEEVFKLISEISMTYVEDPRSDAVQCGVLAEATIKVLTAKFGDKGIAEFSSITTNDVLERVMAEMGLR
jgi:hypothetical protein